MGGRDRDDAGPVLSPFSAERARVVTAGLREALEDVRRAVGVLASRVLAAHAARVWAPLGYPSWAAYCAAEFGISRAQAYRLLDVAHALGTIQAAVTAGTPVPRMRDTTPPPAAVLDYGLSQRALIAASARSCDVADLITRRLSALAHSGLRALDEPTVRAVVRQAVRDVRARPGPGRVADRDGSGTRQRRWPESEGEAAERTPWTGTMS
ncbi:hypothetical protein ACFW5D_35280 [Streptomyces sp. NPDC058770]|uniref:hypothetical protein n=1 Tax=Streptomyces sp. NPDC058770 TaxID=3346631 RepID=UPI0036CEFDFB